MSAYDAKSAVLVAIFVAGCLANANAQGRNANTPRPNAQGNTTAIITGPVRTNPSGNPFVNPLSNVPPAVSTTNRLQNNTVAPVPGLPVR
jgi:hypothetical protein